MSAYFNNKDTISFRLIVLEQLKKILELSNREFKADYKKTIVKSDHLETTESEDTRKVYIQAIESFTTILLPHFDKDMQEKYEELIKPIELFDFEFLDQFKEVVTAIYNRSYVEADIKNISFNELEQIHINIQLKNAKLLFKELNLLLFRKKYLKTSVYSEYKEELEEEEEEEEITDLDKE